MDTVTASDMLFRDRMERGSKALVRAMALERIGEDPAGLPRKTRPGLDLIWPHEKGRCGWAPDPESATSRRGELTLARLIARDRRADAQRTFRDPCPNCGVRADIGCRHRRVAA